MFGCITILIQNDIKNSQKFCARFVFQKKKKNSFWYTSLTDFLQLNRVILTLSSSIPQKFWLVSVSQTSYSRSNTLQEKIICNIRWYLIIKYVMFFMIQCSVPLRITILHLIIDSFTAYLVNIFLCQAKCKASGCQMNKSAPCCWSPCK